MPAVVRVVVAAAPLVALLLVLTPGLAAAQATDVNVVNLATVEGSLADLIDTLKVLVGVAVVSAGASLAIVVGQALGFFK